MNDNKTPRTKLDYSTAFNLAKRSGASHPSTVASIIALYERAEARTVLNGLMLTRPDWWE